MISIRFTDTAVYVIVYSNLFVVKQVKNSPANGVLTLHSETRRREARLMYRWGVSGRFGR